MPSEENCAAGFVGLRARRHRHSAEQRLGDTGPGASVASSYLGSGPTLHNGFMSGLEAFEDLEDVEEIRADTPSGDAGHYRLRDVQEDEDVEDEDFAEYLPSMHSSGTRGSDDEDWTGTAATLSGRPGAADAKKARVENIVSNMVTGPSQTGPVNGCKKRKLYQPQHADRASRDAEDIWDNSSDEEPFVKHRRIDREVLKEDLFRLQAKVAKMQRRYREMRGVEEDLDSDDSAGDIVSRDEVRSSPLRDIKPSVSEMTPLAVADVKRPPPEARPTCIVRPQTTMDVDRLVAALKSEMVQILLRVMDGIVSRFTERRRKSPSPPTVPKDRSLLTQMLDCKPPRGVAVPKITDRGRAKGDPHPSQPVLNTASLRRSPCAGPSQSAYPGESPYKITSFQQEGYEQTEAMSLVVPAKKKRHKVTDMRLTPRDSPKCGEKPGCPPPPLVPASLSAPAAVPSPSLHSDGFPSHVDYPRMYGGYPGGSHPPPLPALLLMQSPNSLHYPPLHPLPPPLPGARHRQESRSDIGGSQDYGSSPSMMSFFRYINDAETGGSARTSVRATPPGLLVREGSSQKTDSAGGYKGSSMSASFGGGPGGYTSTLTPMHLRKAKLMFFYVRYPSSAILKMYFPDVNFNKNNTAQLVKWFSNFREFYYIQMEKYARQSVNEGVKNVGDIKIGLHSELLRVLNIHYNRNNYVEVPETFRYAVEQTLREFFRAILAGKDQEQSWKKVIYKVIARLDDSVPEYFKSPNFLQQLD